ncbi:hypothetical protein D3C77_802240 [compost metagenome]
MSTLLAQCIRDIGVLLTICRYIQLNLISDFRHIIPAAVGFRNITGSYGKPAGRWMLLGVDIQLKLNTILL